MPSCNELNDCSDAGSTGARSADEVTHTLSNLAENSRRKMATELCLSKTAGNGDGIPPSLRRGFGSSSRIMGLSTMFSYVYPVLRRHWGRRIHSIFVPAIKIPCAHGARILTRVAFNWLVHRRMPTRCGMEGKDGANILRWVGCEFDMNRFVCHVCGVDTLLSMPWKCSENALSRMRSGYWTTLECGRACSRLVMRGRSHAKTIYASSGSQATLINGLGSRLPLALAA